MRLYGRFIQGIWGFGVVAVMMASALSVSAQTCIDHAKVGVSGCLASVPSGGGGKGKKPQEPDMRDVKAPAPQPSDMEKQIQRQASAAAMSVEEFYQTYDKPPREYVEWTLNPTVENALRWVQKYNETMDRNRKMAEAWTAAQQIYEQAQQTGQPLPGLQNSLPPVPDYNETMVQMGLVPPTGVPGVPSTLPQPAFNPSLTLSEPMQGSDASRTADAISTARQALQTGGSLTPSSAFRAGEPVQMSYYFSAQCPYCAQFEPVLNQVLSEMGEGVDITCVDTTPTTRTEANIMGKVKCSWRPLMPGELQAFGVQSTPTLIIHHNDDEPLMRLSGAITAEQLRRALQ